MFSECFISFFTLKLYFLLNTHASIFRSHYFVCNPRSKEFNNIAVITGTKTLQIYDADEMLYRETYSGMFIT